MQFTLNQKKAHDLNRHISVTAGAGSGKTAVLASRYLKILLEKDVRPGQVVAITFTEKAAAELKQRIISQLTGEDNLRLEAIKEGMTSAPISTIHSFCARILREFPVEAGIAAGFSVLQGIEQRLVLQETIGSTLRSIAARPVGDATREDLALLLRIFGKDRLEGILRQLVNHRDTLDRLVQELFSQADEKVLNYWQEFMQEELAQSLKRQFPLEEWLRCLNATLALAKGKNAVKVRELMDGILGLTGSISTQGLDARTLTPILSEISSLILTKSRGISKRDFIGSRVKTEMIEAEIAFLVKAANHFQSLPPLTDDDVLLIRVTQPLLKIYQQTQHAYELDKAQQGQLDFEDLQIHVKNLLKDESIRERLAQKYLHIMVDEYQDTNRLQYEILKPLISDFQSGNLFIVGDGKQGIYGFRGADVRVFHQTLAEMTAYQATLTDDFAWAGETLEAETSERRGELHLPENFRMLRNLVSFVNLLFEYTMGTNMSNEFEVAYEPLIQGRANDTPGNVELIVAGSHVAQRNEAIREATFDNENDLIAARIRHLIGTESPVWERDDEGENTRAVRYGDIAILIRSRTHLPEIEEALLKENIPYQITGGIGFYQRQEIYDIRNYLQFLVNSADDIALVGILRAPFFGVSDPELYEISREFIADKSQAEENDGKSNRIPFWNKVQAYNATQSKIGNPKFSIQCAVQTLTNHLEICRRLPFSALIRQIVNDTGMIGIMSAGQQGEQRWANYQKLLGVAREFEKAGFTDLADFLERLNILIDEEEREGQAETQLTDDAVQVMTVHAAKGLEFPIVILPHLHRRFRFDTEPFIDDKLGIGFSPANPDENYKKSNPTVTQLMKNRSRDKTIAEEKRLFYVAATRARDRLVLAGTLDRKENAHGWFGWLFDVLGISGMPEQSQIIRPVTVQTLTDDKTTRVSFDLPIHVIRSLDELDFAEEEPPPPPPIAFPAFHIHPLEPALVGETFSVTQLATYAYCPTRFYLQHQLRLPDTQIEANKPLASDRNGTARGMAVHHVLAKLRTKADCEQDLEPLINAAVRSTGGVVSAKTIRHHVQSFLESETGKVALAAQESHCERHIYAQIGGHTIHGIVDRLIKDGDGLWRIIDYKTDVIEQLELADRASHYRPQIELYAFLVHRLYPEQGTIPITMFFTHLAEAYSMALTAKDLQDVERAWLKRVEKIQSGRFEKDTAHCPLCPYFVNESCLISD